MMRANPWESYQSISLETASPGKLVLMLYDGALKFLEQALEGFGYEDPLMMNQTVHNNLVRAQDIISELNATLNMEAGGELAKVLRDLYIYLGNRLWDSNLKKDRKGVDEVILRVTDLRDAWAEMLDQNPVIAAGETVCLGEMTA